MLQPSPGDWLRNPNGGWKRAAERDRSNCGNRAKVREPGKAQELGGNRHSGIDECTRDRRESSLFDQNGEKWVTSMDLNKQYAKGEMKGRKLTKCLLITNQISRKVGWTRPPWLSRHKVYSIDIHVLCPCKTAQYVLRALTAITWSAFFSLRYD